MPAARSRKKVGVVELIAYTVASEWAEMLGVPSLKRQFYSIMPQVVSVWCRQLGHEVTYATYYGQKDPVRLLPDDLDVVFIAASTQASALAYALAKIYRAKGVLTVAGGPHAKCFPEDCTRFFDITVTKCDKALIADIVAGRIDCPAIVASEHPPAEFPSVEERLPELAVAAFHRGRPTHTSIISLWGSVGCPYTCGFCTDWNSTYVRVPAGQLGDDIRFVADHFPRTLLGFQDPNFGIRLDDAMSLLEQIPPERRSPYLMQCSISVLTAERLKRLGGTRCLYVAPGIESWSEFGNKMKLKTTTGRDRVGRLAGQFADLRQHVPGLQANFVMGLDSDHGDQPFELTEDFLTRVPFVWPNINILTPYGSTPVYDQFKREGRLIRAMPLALYCSPYLSMIVRNYDVVGFYDRFIRLLEASTSRALTVARAVMHDRLAIKLARFAQTVAVRRDIKEMRAIRTELIRSPELRAFHEGRSDGLPAFYASHLKQRLGRFGPLLTPEDLLPVPYGG